MDALQDWALAYPAVARLLWVIVLVLATLLVWSFFFCCWDSRSSVSPLETYLSAEGGVGRAFKSETAVSATSLWHSKGKE
ncbi:hypothetical protein AOLI_G00321490 [Acnodon oligacanthus]